MVLVWYACSAKFVEDHVFVIWHLKIDCLTALALLMTGPKQQKQQQQLSIHRFIQNVGFYNNMLHDNHIKIQKHKLTSSLTVYSSLNSRCVWLRFIG